jgi:hypothetical protein
LTYLLSCAKMGIRKKSRGGKRTSLGNDIYDQLATPPEV